jgi:hypothetical protein
MTREAEIIQNDGYTLPLLLGGENKITLIAYSASLAALYISAWRSGFRLSCEFFASFISTIVLSAAPRAILKSAGPRAVIDFGAHV